MAAMGFGQDKAAAYREYGVLLNEFGTYQSEIQQSDKLFFIYIMNSEKV